MATVTIRLLDDTISTSPVAGAFVQFFSTGGVIQTSGTTDADGEVVVSLPEASYDVLIYKQGASILPRQPQRIEVDDDLTNTFEVTCHLSVLPESTDTTKTRVSGYIRSGAGAATKTRLMLSPVKQILNVSGRVILPESRFEIASDDTGYFDFELLRGQKYLAYPRDVDEIIGVIPPALLLIVPDRAGIELDKLLLPIPQTVTFTDDAISLEAEGDFDDSIEFVIAWNDFSTNENRPEGTPWAGILFSSSDEDVLGVDRQTNKLVLTPRAAGTATVVATRTFNTLAEWTDPVTFESDTLTVTVA